VRLPKLTASNSTFTTFFTIYGVQKFCEKVNKEIGTRWVLTDISNDDEWYICTLRQQGDGLTESVVNALNEEIWNNVYDDSVYKRLYIKSIVWRAFVGS
jgi:hypothetical protein